MAVWNYITSIRTYFLTMFGEMGGSWAWWWSLRFQLYDGERRGMIDPDLYPIEHERQRWWIKCAPFPATINHGRIPNQYFVQQASHRLVVKKHPSILSFFFFSLGTCSDIDIRVTSVWYKPDSWPISLSSACYHHGKSIPTSFTERKELGWKTKPILVRHEFGTHPLSWW